MISLFLISTGIGIVGCFMMSMAALGIGRNLPPPAAPEDFVGARVPAGPAPESGGAEADIDLTSESRIP